MRMSFVLIASSEVPATAASPRAVRDEVKARIADPAVSRLIVTAGPDDTHPDRFLAQVIAALMRAERLDVEVGYAPDQPTPATGIYRLPHGAQARELAEQGTAVEIPLIRDDAATVLLGSARHLGAEGARLHGESYVDDHRLFSGTVSGIRIEPTRELPGLRARPEAPAGWRRLWRREPWHPGRAVQTGGSNLVVEREGALTERAVKRSTFYRHDVDLKLVCR